MVVEQILRLIFFLNFNNQRIILEFGTDKPRMNKDSKLQIHDSDSTSQICSDLNKQNYRGRLNIDLNQSPLTWDQLEVENINNFVGGRYFPPNCTSKVITIFPKCSAKTNF